ncbi:hypothetical protein LWC34_22800 [Kibdelosporangium philippinense]|uniref:Secreted protein n=1 Tax=Kibdelosporangium philippinense TaxID=211113 RepID=A0ABS8ZED9_9PSEU|nr:hypothetical protein [Kibdelosporangium philippinense]MCE7005634.1 hypothetical protein [Kibdelosporangium philippinense]
MRLLRLTLPALVVAALATPAQAAQPPTGPPSGWSVTGNDLIWESAEPLPVGDSAVEFWDGETFLGRPIPSGDHRTFTLTTTSVVNPRDLSVRASGKRLDIEEQTPPLKTQPVSPPAPLPASAVDPGTPGPFKTTSGEYTLDSISLPDYPAAIEMQGLVVAPVGAPGRRPLALFLHGRHISCYDPADPKYQNINWPCLPDKKPVPSYTGYQQTQQLMASQGYVTVSISANGINGQDARVLDLGAQGRSSLVRQHLTHWAEWAGAGRDSAPDIVKAAPIADLSQVFLMGHSRGGEGVNRAAMDSINPPPGDTLPTRWKIKGTLLIGPTIFGHNPAADVPSATILPGCDGDVADLQGQMFIDGTRGISRGAALHSALYFVGANHNFFNTEWTPGQSVAPSSDDFRSTTDPVCSPGTPTRLTAAQQQTAGATYIAAAAQLFVGGDRRVLPLLDGSGVRAPSADPARVLAHAVGGERASFVVPDSSTKTEGAARLCKQVTRVEGCGTPSRTHFVTFRSIAEDPDRYAVSLTGAGVVRPAKPVSLAGSRSLALRLIVPPNTKGNQFDVAITDTHGRKAQLGSVTLDGLPASSAVSAHWGQEARVPLHGIDLRQVASLEVVPRGTEPAWLLDAYGWNTGLPDPRPVPLSRVDLGTSSVQEGDSGTRTVQIPVSVSGDREGAVRLFLTGPSGEMTTRLVTVQPGQRTIDVPIEVVGNTRWSRGANYTLFAKAVRGTVAGAYRGGLAVVDEDPMPQLTISPAATTTEGGTLKWTVTASAVADAPLSASGQVIVPAQGPELSSTDVDPVWFKEQTGRDPVPATPLSSSRLGFFAAIPPGSLTAEITVPTVRDSEAEPAEHIYAKLQPGLELVGSVTD